MVDQNQNFTSPIKDPAVLDQIALSAFIDDLIKAKNDPHLKQEDIPAVKEVLLGEVNEAINTHLVNLLSEKTQVELDKLLDTDPSDEQLNQFFIRNIPRLEVEVAAALLNFRAAYLYPLREQIAKAVGAIAPAHQSRAGEEEKLVGNEGPSLAPAPVQRPTTHTPFPQAPTAPISTDPTAVKKWN